MRFIAGGRVVVSFLVVAACGDELDGPAATGARPEQFVTSAASLFTDVPSPRACAAGRAGRRDQGPVHCVLTETWEPESGDVIDCRGGSILPATLASDNDGLSVPDNLIYLGADVHGVRIENCTLDATLPIVALEGGWHRISGNTIDATSTAVLFLGSDHNLVDHNVVSASFGNVVMVGDSDGNVVWRNDLYAPPPGRPGWEGGPGLLVETYPGGLGVTVWSRPGVLNAVVNGELHQHVTYRDMYPEGTQVVANAVHNEGWGGGSNGIIFAARSSHAFATRAREPSGSRAMDG